MGATTLTALWLLVVAAASSDGLHALLHPDAHQASHDCVLAQVAQGQVDTPAGAWAVSAPDGFPGQPLAVRGIPVPPPPGRPLQPARDPPVFPSFPL